MLLGLNTTEGFSERRRGPPPMTAISILTARVPLKELGSDLPAPSLQQASTGSMYQGSGLGSLALGINTHPPPIITPVECKICPTAGRIREG